MGGHKSRLLRVGQHSLPKVGCSMWTTLIQGASGPLQSDRLFDPQCSCQPTDTNLMSIWAIFTLRNNRYKNTSYLVQGFALKEVLAIEMTDSEIVKRVIHY